MTWIHYAGDHVVDCEDSTKNWRDCVLFWPSMACLYTVMLHRLIEIVKSPIEVVYAGDKVWWVVLVVYGHWCMCLNRHMRGLCENLVLFCTFLVEHGYFIYSDVAQIDRAYPKYRNMWYAWNLRYNLYLHWFTVITEAFMVRLRCLCVKLAVFCTLILYGFNEGRVIGYR